jgi:hypothetical protein
MKKFLLLMVLASSTCSDQNVFYHFAVQTTTPSGLGTSVCDW